MSRYAYFACRQCAVKLWLGKAVTDQDERVVYFHIGDVGGPRNSEQPEVDRSLWKLLADHAGHSLCVIVEGDPEYGALGDYATIGGDGVDDIPFNRFLEGWPG
jgi:hypothetical protein